MPILLAGIEDFLGILFPLVVMIIYVIGQLVAKSQEAAQREQQRRRMQQRPQQRPPERQPQARVGGDDDVEDFLRRVAQQRQEGPPRQVEVVPPQAPEQPVETILTRERERSGPSKVPPRATAQQPPAQEARAAQPKYQSQASREAAEMDAHIREVFGEDSGGIQDAAEYTEPGSTVMETQIGPPSQLARSISDMLRNPQDVGRAVVLSEILRRPEERW